MCLPLEAYQRTMVLKWQIERGFSDLRFPAGEVFGSSEPFVDFEAGRIAFAAAGRTGAGSGKLSNSTFINPFLQHSPECIRGYVKMIS